MRTRSRWLFTRGPARRSIVAFPLLGVLVLMIIALAMVLVVLRLHRWQPRSPKAHGVSAVVDQSKVAADLNRYSSGSSGL
jgi:hypothetical protein